MKKDKQAAKKVARKQLTSEIKQSLVAKIKEFTDAFVPEAKGVTKEIHKASGKLSKRLYKKLKKNISDKLESAGELQQTPEKISPKKSANDHLPLLALSKSPRLTSQLSKL